MSTSAFIPYATKSLATESHYNFKLNKKLSVFHWTNNILGKVFTLLLQQQHPPPPSVPERERK
jgi:hypothetical protein